MEYHQKGVAMFSNIVVGTDGSDTAKVAVSLAADLAKLHNAVLHLVNASNMPASGLGAQLAGATGVADQAVGAEVSKNVLAEAAREAKGANVETHASVGDPADVVISVAEKVGADLIVVGSKGMHGIRRVIGSIPNTIAHQSPCNVLIVKTT